MMEEVQGRKSKGGKEKVCQIYEIRWFEKCVYDAAVTVPPDAAPAGCEEADALLEMIKRKNKEERSAGDIVGAL